MSEKKIGYIRTSDRAAFKRCRRRWNWSSSMGKNLEENISRGPLWMGTGFHFALEDYHGYNKYGHPAEAFREFVKACRKAPGKGVPGDFEELTSLCTGMLNYYVEWLKNRDTLQTYWVDGVPQVEVKFEIPLPLPEQVLFKSGYDEIRYQGTIDRVVIDEHERLWLLDHKTAKQFVMSHFETDPQITSYCWAAAAGLFDKEIAGFIYQQYKKIIPEEPEPLKSGKISTAKSLVTTHALYRRALINLYGSITSAPVANVEYLNSLAEQEGPDEDSVIRRDYVYRTHQQLEAEGEKILQEAIEMLDPGLSLYPNPTRDCTWDCGFLNACILKDCGDDYETELALTTEQRDQAETNWRNYL